MGRRRGRTSFAHLWLGALVGTGTVALAVTESWSFGYAMHVAAGIVSTAGADGAGPSSEGAQLVALVLNLLGPLLWARWLVSAAQSEVTSGVAASSARVRQQQRTGNRSGAPRTPRSANQQRALSGLSGRVKRVLQRLRRWRIAWFGALFALAWCGGDFSFISWAQ